MRLSENDRGRWLWVILLAVLLLAGSYYFSSRQPVGFPPAELSDRVETLPQPNPRTAGLPVEAELDNLLELYREPPLPPLDHSNPLVMAALAALSRDPVWPLWLQSEELVRKFVVAIDNLAAGKVLRKYIVLPAPKGAFQVEARADGLYPLDSSYWRYDQYVDIFSAMDEQALLRVYRQFRPLLESAYQELGYPPERRFHDTLLKALERLLATPPFPPESPRLTQTSVMYEYADPELEALSPLARQLWRLGPENLTRVRQKLAVMLKLLKEMP